MPLNSLAEWLSYIETLHPKTIALGLERVQAVADTLNVRKFACPVITVGGTNGKGSCVTFLAAILQQAGYRVGQYTSPHLLHFQERASINQQIIAEPEWVEALTQVEQARGSTPLTYFEMTTLAVLWLFHRAKLDVVILEVGLGGRLDAVNIVDADVAVITTVAMDHMDWLGNDRETIAKEKAGIFRNHKPAVCGDFNPPASVLEQARLKQTPLYCLQRDFSYQQRQTDWDWHSAERSYLALPMPTLPLQNAATALMALQCLPLIVEQSAIIQGLQKAYLPGRFQQLQLPVPCIVDVAHNPAAAALLAEQLAAKPIAGKTLAVVSILADKDITGTLQPLLSCVDSWYAAGLQVARGVSAEALVAQLNQLGVNDCHAEYSVTAAFKQALADCGASDRIVVFGSFHTVAEILAQYSRDCLQFAVRAGFNK